MYVFFFLCMRLKYLPTLYRQATAEKNLGMAKNPRAKMLQVSFTCNFVYTCSDKCLHVVVCFSGGSKISKPGGGGGPEAVGSLGIVLMLLHTSHISLHANYN